LTQAISSDPSNVRVALDMGQIFLDIGEIEQAQSVFDRLPEVAQKLDIGISIITNHTNHFFGSALFEFSIIFLNEKQGFYATLCVALVRFLY
jgi:hypothetical protein